FLLRGSQVIVVFGLRNELVHHLIGNIFFALLFRLHSLQAMNFSVNGSQQKQQNFRWSLIGV
ncbi:hypothetical protein ACJX0J_021373, partial [Zea mays]